MLRNRATAVAALLVVLGAARIVMTCRVFSVTVDEGTHLSAGLELLQFHRYTVQRENPPFPRVIMTVIPFLTGLRVTPGGGFYQEQRSIFYGRGKYDRNLVLVRIGNLLFFLIAAAALYFWSLREAGEAVAVLAVLLFTTQPVVLGYCGLATHDAAAVAGLAAGLLAFSVWLEQPTLRRSILVGLAYGFSISCKFSSIAFVPAACGAIYIVRLIHDQQWRHAATLLTIPPVAFLVVWAGYGFTMEKFIPAPDFWLGVSGLLQLDRRGMISYLLGQTTTRGWWWYFPLAIGLKTTLPFLCALCASVVISFSPQRHRGHRVILESALAALAILAICMRSRLDLGVRYALPLYVPLTLATAAGAAALIRSGSRDVRRGAILLIGLHVAVSFYAHPDYFPYFNVLAGRDPSRYLVDSNLDWGQDVLRLRRVTRQLHIPRIGVLMAGDPDYGALGFPTTYRLAAEQKTDGWIAVGEHLYRTQQARGAWSWLDPYNMRRVGTSIRLYYIPPCDGR
jgi:4-amino-4-deoxy-L-arabinose transferase-like glycosyltransferase